MPNSFFGIETGLRALRTAQTAMDTASHNIANANTPGYSRQRVEFQVTDPYTTPSQWYPIGAMQIGTGVEARTITQARDRALDAEIRQGYGARESQVALKDALGQVEDAVGEPGEQGIVAAMTGFFNALHDLTGDAASTALRGAAVASAQTVTGTFRQVSGRIATVQSDVTGRLDASVREINGIAGQIATLNAEIQKVVAHGDQPNDLRDQRDQLLDSLAKKINTTVFTAPDGSLTVQAGGATIVRGMAALPVAGLSDLNANNQLTGGEMGGLMAAQTRIAAYQTDLDALAQTFMSGANAQHAAGLDKNGNAGGALFTGTGAADIAVRAPIAADPDKLAAAATPAPPATFAVGNGDNALALADLATGAFTIGSQSGVTLRGFWGDAASTIGVEVKTLSGAVAGHDAFVGQLESRREAISGVSLDDEMADLVKFQRAYQAAAKLISISDEMTETLINAFGR